MLKYNLQLYVLFKSIVAGDVTVGWINGRTGKGSVDDYFLAHPSKHKYGAIIKCSDGAESCPDESKPVIMAPSLLKYLISIFYILSKIRTDKVFFTKDVYIFSGWCAKCGAFERCI